MALDGLYPQLPDLGLRMPDLALKLREQVLPNQNLPRGRYQREISSENHVWDGQRRTPLSFTQHRTAGISLTGGNGYSLTFSQGWANASMPKDAGELRENQSGHWEIPLITYLYWIPNRHDFIFFPSKVQMKMVCRMFTLLFSIQWKCESVKL